jgi:hypothetical protein
MPALPSPQPVAALHSAPSAQRPASGPNLYYIGRDRLGHWVVRDATGRSGGVFIDRLHAIKFAMFETGRDPQAVIMVPGILELDLK